MKFYTLLPLALAPLAMAGTISLSDPYLTSQNPEAQSAGGFLLIENTGEDDVRLVGAQADIAKKIELHTHMMKEGGAMEMVEVEGGIVIPAKGCAVLRRGEYHIMFMGVGETLESGDSVDVELIFDNGETVDMVFPIDRERGSDYVAPMPETSDCNGAPQSMMHDAQSHDGETSH